MRIFGRVRTRRPMPRATTTNPREAPSSAADQLIRPARIPRASSAAGRLSVRRLPERALHAERDPVEVPRWLRKYGQAAWLLIGIIIVVGLVVFTTTRIQAVFIGVFLALVVTSVLYPMVSLLARVMPRALATALTILAALAIVAGIFTYVITSVAGQWEDLANQFGDGIDQIFE
ncbi:AI-2E family transporter, partial [Ruania albidiflava]|uniref:AI-2E family transporter n=1 Tax=Ruania albidiflava TaxID=366586 RepID=UPI0030B8ED0B